MCISLKKLRTIGRVALVLILFVRNEAIYR